MMKLSLASNLAMSLAPELLFERVVGSPPDAWQRDLLNCQDSKIAVLASRQVGKSRTTSVVAAHHAIYSPGSLVVVGSASLAQSQELGRSIFSAIREVEPEVVAQNLTRIELHNGSRVICLPASESVRGLANCSLLIIDEAARVEPPMFAALEPMQATAKNPRLILLSTPRARIGKFFEYWTGGDFTRFEARAEDCPRISKQFLASQLKNLGPMMFNCEYGLQWLDDQGALFSDEPIQAALEDYAGIFG
jgi:hypothetical protein